MVLLCFIGFFESECVFLALLNGPLETRHLSCHPVEAQESLGNLQGQC